MTPRKLTIAMNPVEEAVLLVAMRRATLDGTALLLRQKAGLSQDDVGHACGVTGAAVQRWETGARIPRGVAARHYARLLAELGLKVEPAIA